MSEQTQAVAPNDATLDFGESMTVEMWFRADAYPPSNQTPSLVLKKGDSYLVTLLSDGGLRCESPRGSAAAGSVMLDVWTHVACVDDGERISLYIDGVEALSVPIGPQIPNPMDTDLILGNDQLFARPLLGAIDNVRVWRTGLDPVDICFAAGRDDC